MSTRAGPNQEDIHVSIFDGHPSFLVDTLVSLIEPTLIISFIRPILSKCMAKFMRPSLDFADLNRFERISCIKVRMFE